MIRVNLQYVSSDIDARGNVRYYFRRRGQRKIRLHGKPHSAEFTKAYSAALAGQLIARQLMSGPATGSLRWLCTKFFASAEFKRLDVKTRGHRRGALETVCRQPLSSTDAALVGSLGFSTMPPLIVRVLRDRRADQPHGANSWLIALTGLFKWACEAGLANANPAKDIPRFKTSSQGHHTWSVEEVHQFENAHPIGSMPRLALALLLYTGQRRSDVVLFGRQHIRNGQMQFTQQKNRNRKPVTLTIPVLLQLQAIIDASDCKHLTFLISSHGKPFTNDGFSHRFRTWCDRAGLPQCTAHGLRKAGAVLAAHNGATTHQLMAIFGWRNINQAEVYTRAASQQKMAHEGMHLLVRK